MIKIWSIDGRSYNDIPILDFELFVEILDGSGTGRMQTVGWDMFRQPEGTIFNVSIVAGILLSNSTKNDSFIHLFNTLNGFGTYDFKSVSFVTPVGLMTQDMYSPSYSIKMEKIDKDDVSYWGSIPITFIAKRAYLT